MLADLIDWSKLDAVEVSASNLCEGCVFDSVGMNCGDVGLQDKCEGDDVYYIFVLKKEQNAGGVTC